MRSIGTPELLHMMSGQKRFALINTLDPEKFQVTRIPGSRNIPLGSSGFVERVEECCGGMDQPVVVYSADSTCSLSTEAAEELEAAGFTEVYEYTGGALAWESTGGVLVRT